MSAEPRNKEDPIGAVPLNSRNRGEALSFVWWNTNLAPPRGRVSTPEQQNVAARLVEGLVVDLSVDFIALGEVSAREKERFSTLAEIVGYRVLDGFAESGRSRFDMLFLYDGTRLQASKPTAIEAAKGGKTFRVAQEVVIVVSGATWPIHLLVSHWPSRLHMPKDAPDRSLLGMRLRNAVTDLLKSYGEHAPNIILLGDYNDEPFDNSLAEFLLSTRDRNFAKRRPHLLYNPFWRYLGAACDDPQGETIVLGGTYYHNEGDVTRWRLFDQMIFSRSFLTGGEWVLDENFTQFIDVPSYSRLLDDRNEYFDHAPVLGVVRRLRDD